MVCRTSVGPNFQRNCSRKSVSVNLKISILEPTHAKWATQYYDHICTNKVYCEKMDGLRSGITKMIKEDIRKEDPFEN